MKTIKLVNVLSVVLMILTIGILTVLSILPPPQYFILPLTRAQFESRRAQWESNQVTHYRATINSASPMMVVCPTATLEVQDNMVIEIQTTADHWTETDLRENCSDYYNVLTIDGIFDTASDYLYRRVPDVGWYGVKLSYDPQYGYPTHFRVIQPAIGDMPNITITDFEVLD